jgi:hypothetical protein
MAHFTVIAERATTVSNLPHFVAACLNYPGSGATYPMPEAEIRHPNRVWLSLFKGYRHCAPIAAGASAREILKNAVGTVGYC